MACGVPHQLLAQPPAQVRSAPNWGGRVHDRVGQPVIHRTNRLVYQTVKQIERLVDQTGRHDDFDLDADPANSRDPIWYQPREYLEQFHPVDVSEGLQRLSHAKMCFIIDKRS